MLGDVSPDTELKLPHREVVLSKWVQFGQGQVLTWVTQVKFVVQVAFVAEFQLLVPELGTRLVAIRDENSKEEDCQELKENTEQGQLEP